MPRSPYLFPSTLSLNDCGPAVFILQMFLLGRGLLAGKKFERGVYGQSTKEAVEILQKDCLNIEADGVFGPPTIQKISLVFGFNFVTIPVTVLRRKSKH